MLLTYDTKCEYDDGTTGKSTSLACIAGVFDWNGDAKPNGYGLKNDSDIIPIGAINAVARGNVCIVPEESVGGTCFTSKPFVANDTTTGGCQNLLKQKIVTSCDSKHPDYWANAYLECKKAGGSLPSETDLTNLSNYLYDGLKLNYTRARALGFNINDEEAFWVWSVQPYGSLSACYQLFVSYGNSGYGHLFSRSYPGGMGICVAD